MSNVQLKNQNGTLLYPRTKASLLVEDDGITLFPVYTKEETRSLLSGYYVGTLEGYTATDLEALKQEMTAYVRNVTGGEPVSGYIVGLGQGAYNLQQYRYEEAKGSMPADWKLYAQLETNPISATDSGNYKLIKYNNYDVQVANAITSQTAEKSNNVKTWYWQVPPVISQWANPSEYTDFPYYADITVEGMSDDYVPTVNFDIATVMAGNVAPFCTTGTNKIRIYSATESNATVNNVTAVKVFETIQPTE